MFFFSGVFRSLLQGWFDAVFQAYGIEGHSFLSIVVVKIWFHCLCQLRFRFSLLTENF